MRRVLVCAALVALLACVEATTHAVPDEFAPASDEQPVVVEPHLDTEDAPFEESAFARADHRRPGGLRRTDAEAAHRTMHQERNQVQQRKQRHGRAVRAQGASGNDFTTFKEADAGVTTYHAVFPGRVDQSTFFDGGLMVSRCAGNLYLSRDHGLSWTVYTDADVMAPLKGNVDQYWTQFDALPTRHLSRAARQNLNGMIAVRTSTATYAISTERNGDQVPPTEFVIAPSAALSQYPQLKPGAVAFTALEFHPTLPNKRAFAFLRDPSCGVFSSDCTYFAFVTLNLKDFYLVPAVHTTVLMWENPVPPHIANFSIPVSERDGDSIDEGKCKDYDPDGFFVVVDENMRNHWSEGGTLFRVSTDLDWAKIVSIPTTNVIASHVLYASAEEGYEYAVLVDQEKMKTTVKLSKHNFRALHEMEFPASADGNSSIGGEIGYDVLDVREDIFVAVFRYSSNGAQRMYADAYMSGLRGLRYTKSLSHVRNLLPTQSDLQQDGMNFYEPAFGMDFHRLEGVDGTLLANRIHNAHSAACAKCVSASCASRCSVHTEISRDDGKTWQPLLGRSEKSDGGRHYVRLHLHGRTGARTTGVFTSHHAPGLVIGHGNAGQQLETQRNSFNVIFMSRDGGNAWKPISWGPHVFGESDFGSLIFFVRKGDTGQPPHVSYSFDAGGAFQKAMLSTTANITVQWGGRPVHDPVGRYGFVSGSDEEGNTRFIRMSFPAASRKCTGLDTPNEDDSDFETFSPRGFFANKKDDDACILGRHEVYVRRKRGVDCWIEGQATTIDVGLVKSSTPCLCTYDDFECDFGYVSKDNNVEDGSEASASGSTAAVDVQEERCVPESPPTPEEICDAAQAGHEWALVYMDMTKTKYRPSKGYRRIAGDGCHGGVEQSVEPGDYVPCPGSTTSEPKHLGVILFVVVLVIAALVLVFSESARQRLADGVEAIKDRMNGNNNRVQRYGRVAADDAEGSTTAGQSGGGTALHDDDEDDDADEAGALVGGASGLGGNTNTNTTIQDV